MHWGLFLFHVCMPLVDTRNVACVLLTSFPIVVFPGQYRPRYWRPERSFIQPSRSQDSRNTKTGIKKDCFLADGEAFIDLLCCLLFLFSIFTRLVVSGNKTSSQQVLPFGHCYVGPVRLPDPGEHNVKTFQKFQKMVANSYTLQHLGSTLAAPLPHRGST